MGFRSKIHRALADIAGSFGQHDLTKIAFPSGSYWYANPGLPTDPAAGNEATNLKAYPLPMYLPSRITFDRIGCHVAFAGSAGALARLGIYRSHPTTFIPDKLLLDAGTVDTTTAGLKTITIDQALEEGFYWVILLPQGSPVTQARFFSINAITGASQQSFAPDIPFKPIGGLNTAYGGFISASFLPAGALPDPWTHGLDVVIVCPIVGMRKT